MDLAAADLSASVPVDLAAPAVDLVGAPCNGGYLNSGAANACPLNCSPKIESVPQQLTFHVPYGTPVAYSHNPPTSGPHWPWHDGWGPHYFVSPREFWVHNLEHGGIIFLYNCPAPNSKPFDGDAGAPLPNDCAADIQHLTSFYTNHTPDWQDGGEPEVRILITGDPYLPTRFAAVAWNWSYTFDQIDDAAINCFIASRYGRGPENEP